MIFAHAHALPAGHHLGPVGEAVGAALVVVHFIFSYFPQVFLHLLG